eukprot:5670780-Karenia_brevis.AAC.1
MSLAAQHQGRRDTANKSPAAQNQALLQCLPHTKPCVCYWSQVLSAQPDLLDCIRGVSSHVFSQPSRPPPVNQADQCHQGAGH